MEIESLRNIVKRLWLLFTLPLIIVAVGTTGFMIIEKLSFVDSLYFTIVTISTVGYGDIHPTTIAGKLFGIVLIIFGIGSFLTIITRLTQLLMARGRERLRAQRLNMIIGVFFTEVGNELLNLFTRFDPQIDEIRSNFAVKDNWTSKDFSSLKTNLKRHEHLIDQKLMDLQTIRDFLKEKGDLLLRQLENPDLVEHESFTELLWSIVHLRDELLARKSLSELPQTDLAHLANDTKRAYNYIVRQWLDYMQHLKRSYPYLFSLAIRTNPFAVNPSAIVK